MSGLLPYYPHASKAELLPTCWSVEKLHGFIFRGSDRRKFELAGSEQSSLMGRRSFNRAPAQSEIVVLGNALVPSVPDYYFEVTFDQLESNNAHLSVGFFPEGSKTWGNGSYRYQANAKKTTFSGGSRRQHDYGTPYRAKSVIGCGYNREEESIYFTKDGADLGAAFPNVQIGRVFPAVGVSKGTHVTVNFGQEPFRYKFNSINETAEEREKRKKEEEEKRKNEKLEEEQQRKREKADRKAANLLSAQPILNMGFDLKMAMVALKQTNYSGPEAASNWLVENMGLFNFDDVVLSDSEDQEEEAKKEEIKEEKPSDKEEARPEDKEKKVPEAPKGAPEDLYNPSGIQSFFLTDNYSNTKNEAVNRKEPQNRLTTDWEESVIPPIKAFMEKDGFSPFEVEEYLQQIRSQLSANNEQQAKGIVLQIVGDTGLQIQFPSAASAASRDKPSLKIEDFKLGAHFSVSSSIVPGEITDKNWVHAMDKTVGQTGIVKGVDHQASMVLVQFYNPELASLTEWWYPVKMLEKADKPTGDNQLIGMTKENVQDKLGETNNELTHLHARKAVLSLLQHAPLEMEGSLNVKDVLNLVAFENVSTPLLTLPPVPFHSGLRTKEDRSSRFYHVLQDRLLSLYETNRSSGLTECLVDQAIQCFDAAATMMKSNGMSFVSSKPPSSAPLLVQHPDASSMVVVFDRAGTSISSNSGTTFSFHTDEAGTELVKMFAEKSRFVPFIVPTGKLWLRTHTPSTSNSGRSGSKYKFTAIPIHPKLGLAFWVVSFLIDRASNFLENLDDICVTLFNSVVDYVYVSPAPSTVKESALYLLCHLMQTVKDQRVLANPLQRLVKLKDEMVGLYEGEKKEGQQSVLLISSKSRRADGERQRCRRQIPARRRKERGKLPIAQSVRGDGTAPSRSPQKEGQQEGTQAGQLAKGRGWQTRCGHESAIRPGRRSCEETGGTR